MLYSSLLAYNFTETDWKWMSWLKCLTRNAGRSGLFRCVALHTFNLTHLELHSFFQSVIRVEFLYILYNLSAYIHIFMTPLYCCDAWNVPISFYYITLARPFLLSPQAVSPWLWCPCVTLRPEGKQKLEEVLAPRCEELESRAAADVFSSEEEEEETGADQTSRQGTLKIIYWGGTGGYGVSHDELKHWSSCCAHINSFDLSDNEKIAIWTHGRASMCRGWIHLNALNAKWRQSGHQMGPNTHILW